MSNELLKDEIIAKLGDPYWRCNNLYYIKDKKGKKVLFKFNKVQEILWKALWYFNICPKARQLGITTFFTIIYFDQVLFGENISAGIIAHTEKDMKRIFRDKIKFAWDHLPDWLRHQIGEPNNDSAYELVFPKPCGGSIFVSTSTRSGTIQFLHISEFGPICKNSPDKAEEIVTGSINTVHRGQMVSIESTAAGREGPFYDFCMAAQKAQKEGTPLTEMDFRLFFFPWWMDPDYQLPNANFLISKRFQEYFHELDVKHGIKLTDAQKRWYIKKEATNKTKIFEEYPSILEEAFMASTEGAYYYQEFLKVYAQKRICQVPYDKTLGVVDTWWDLGMNDMNIIIFTQQSGSAIRVIDVYSNSGEGLEYYVKILKEKGYNYGMHTFPWDISIRDLSTGVARKDTLQQLGLYNVRVAEKIPVQDGIDRTRLLFSRFYFDEKNTEVLYNALANYRKDWDAKTGVFKSYPRHDKASHFADAMRCLAVAWRDGMDMLYNENETKINEKEQSYF
ncbi:MAG: terminase [Candidatus Gracilibacteria bacterium]|jgi:hypothetical protein